jgi:acetylornithine deacetylase/succinyl-diaminopimelate desuccinylase-like protein
LFLCARDNPSDADYDDGPPHPRPYNPPQSDRELHMPTHPVLDLLAAEEPRSLDRLIDWLRIPSISTIPDHKADCRRAAEWAAAQLRDCGLRSEIIDTGEPPGSGHPVVMGYTHDPADRSAAGAPHVLFYGHYDVQPADPLELWESPPFEPVIRDARPGEAGGRRIVARGAVDDKGQVMMFLEALRAWKQLASRAPTGSSPGLHDLARNAVAGGVRFTVLLEGEEESGSVNLDRFLEQHKAQLSRCSVCVISDTGMLARDKPAITYGVRGLAYTEVTLHGANQDLHSGLWGGRAPNPNNELARVLAQLWDADGRVTIPGFYDKVRPLSPAERAAWKQLGFDPAAALARIGLPPEADEWGGHERGYSALEREWARPTAEINGLCGGYTGPGAKTVIPARASAKVSFRLVADQDPRAIADAFFAWCRARTPRGCRWDFHLHSTGHPATVATDSPFLAAAARAIERATGTPPQLIKSGGSIPVAGSLKAIAGLETVFMGFGLDDDRVHSPNEKFEIDCFRMGARAHALLIDELRSMK